MTKRNLQIDLETARQWYKEGGFKQELALQAFDKNELIKYASIKQIAPYGADLTTILKLYQSVYQEGENKGKYTIVETPSGKFQGGYTKNLPGKVIGGIYFENEYLIKHITDELNNYFNETSK